MGKKQEQAQLVEDLETEVDDLRNALAEEHQRAARLARDNDAFRAREDANRRERAAKAERERKQAERDKRLQRLKHLRAGLLPLEHVAKLAIVHTAVEVPCVEVTVPLSSAEVAELQEYMRASDGKGGIAAAELRERINRMAAGVQRAQGYYTF